MPRYLVTLIVVKTGEKLVEVEAEDSERAQNIAANGTNGQDVECSDVQSVYPIEWREISEEERLRKLGMPQLL